MPSQSATPNSQTAVAKRYPIWFTVIATVICTALCVYLYFMVIWPLYESGGSWTHLQRTWATWQTLNGAIIALVAGTVAVGITVWSLYKRFEMDHTLMEHQKRLAESEKNTRLEAKVKWLCWRLNGLLYDMKLIVLNGKPQKSFTEIREEFYSLEVDIFQLFGEITLASLINLLGDVEAASNSKPARNQLNPTGVRNSIDEASAWLRRVKRLGFETPYLHSYHDPNF